MATRDHSGPIVMFDYSHLTCSALLHKIIVQLPVQHKHPVNPLNTHFCHRGKWLLQKFLVHIALVKGKEKENVGITKTQKWPLADVIDLDNEDEMKMKHGCPPGSGNYSASDVNALLDYVEEELPLGQCGWQVVTTNFNKWATKHGWPDQKLASLEMKYKQLVKTPKPTGTGVCPPEVFSGDNNDKVMKSGENPTHHHKAVACSACAAAAELMNHLSTAFDPEVQKAHDEECANCAIATTQYLTHSQQYHGAQATNDQLHGKIFDLHNELYEMQHKYDHAQMQCEMLQMSHAGGHQQPIWRYHNQPKHKYEEDSNDSWYKQGFQEDQAGPSEEKVEKPLFRHTLKIEKLQPINASKGSMESWGVANRSELKASFKVLKVGCGGQDQGPQLHPKIRSMDKDHHGQMCPLEEWVSGTRLQQIQTTGYDQRTCQGVFSGNKQVVDILKHLWFPQHR
ncbi:hypothetical protein J3A83DRAFT_4184835 [Scleroderma citrinum]